MNVPPKKFIRVMPKRIKTFMVRAFRKAGMGCEDAELMGRLLTASDLRGIHSHGTRQARGYIELLRKEQLNPRPVVRVVNETETTAVLDGDGGLGYFASWRAAHMAVEKAKRHGVGVVVTRNHGHFGAAGHYSRVAAAADCIGIAMSGVRAHLGPDQMVMGAGGAAPMSIAIPSGKAPPFVPDMGMYFHYLYGAPNELEALFGKMPDAFFKFLGLGVTCQLLGGTLAGIYNEALRETPYYEAASQGSFIVAIEAARFGPIRTLKREVDAFIAKAQKMRPFPGHDRALLPGGPEWGREREYTRGGIPIGRQHLEELDALAREVAIEPLVSARRKQA